MLESVELLNETVQEDEQLCFVMLNLKSVTLIGDDGKRYCAKNIPLTNELKQVIEKSLLEERKETKNKIKKLVKTIDRFVKRW